VYCTDKSKRFGGLIPLFLLLCTLYGAVDFLNVLKKGCLGGRGVLLVHNEIHYVPIEDGEEEVLLRNVLHYVTVLLSNHHL
jgi:hypothetical protein